MYPPACAAKNASLKVWWRSLIAIRMERQARELPEACRRDDGGRTAYEARACVVFLFFFCANAIVIAHGWNEFPHA
jgi:hypothetical protein